MEPIRGGASTPRQVSVTAEGIHVLEMDQRKEAPPMDLQAGSHKQARRQMQVRTSSRDETGEQEGTTLQRAGGGDWKLIPSVL